MDWPGTSRILDPDNSQLELNLNVKLSAEVQVRSALSGAGRVPFGLFKLLTMRLLSKFKKKGM